MTVDQAEVELYVIPTIMNQTNPYITPSSDPTSVDPISEPKQYASFWHRFVASFVDGIITGIMGAVAGAIMGFIIGASTGEVSGAGIAGNLIGIVIGWLYGALLESSPKQATWGKQMMKIKVSDLDGNRISFGKATGRHFGKIISSLILLMGYFMMLWTERKQTLHDKMAGCLVTRNG